MAYFELSCDDNGEVSIRQVNIAEYLGQIGSSRIDFVRQLDGYVSPKYWQATVRLLIKGEIVVPRPVLVATKYEVD